MVEGRPELCGFVGSNWVTQLGVVLLGCIAFAGPYITTIQLSAGGAGSSVVRATMAGALGCWLAMAFATMAARGGPLLNTVFYPAAIVALGPPVINAFVMSTPMAVAHPHVPLFSAAWTRIVLVSVLPGIAGGYGLLVIRFGLLMNQAERERWGRRYLPVVFRTEFIDEPARRLRAASNGPSCRYR